MRTMLLQDKKRDEGCLRDEDYVASTQKKHEMYMANALGVTQILVFLDTKCEIVALGV